MELIFNTSGNALGTRFLGRNIRVQIENSIKNGETVVFNFEGVNIISHSFADECFGKLLLNLELQDLKSKTTFKNTNETIKKMISFTLSERISNLELV